MTKYNFEKILLHSTEETQHIARIKINKSGNNIALNIWLHKNFLIAAEMDGKIIEFLADPSKRALAFRVLEKVNQSEMTKHTMKLVKANTTGYCQLGITKLVKSLHVPLSDYNCPIKQYEDDTYGKLFYIEFNEETKRSRKDK